MWHEEVGVAKGGVEEIHMHVRQRTHLREVSKPCDVNDVNTFKGSKGTESKEYVKSMYHQMSRKMGVVHAVRL